MCLSLFAIVPLFQTFITSRLALLALLIQNKNTSLCLILLGRFCLHRNTHTDLCTNSDFRLQVYCVHSQTHEWMMNLSLYTNNIRHRAVNQHHLRVPEDVQKHASFRRVFHQYVHMDTDFLILLFYQEQDD